MLKNCLHCGMAMRGRRDKKFCDDLCRNSFNNSRYGPANNMMRRINRRLSKNWRILQKLSPEKQTFTTREQLMRSGFDFRFFTSLKEISGRRFYYVYDRGFCLMENGDIELVPIPDENVNLL